MESSSGRGCQAPNFTASAPHTGTTIIAVRYKDGVVLGADGRVSVGSYISNRASNKIAPLCDNVYLLRSGSAPDTQLISDMVRFYASSMAAELQTDISVAAVANLVMQINYQNKEALMGAMVIAGWDEATGGVVYGCPIGGTLAEEKWAIDGSGSTYIWGYCDAEYREDMSREDAEAFVMQALALAMASDCSSGGCTRLVTLNKDGAFHRYTKGSEVELFDGDILPPARAMVVG